MDESTYNTGGEKMNNQKKKLVRVDRMTSSDFDIDPNAHFSIQELIIKDTSRTSSFQEAILGNAHLFKDKVVLELGCGLGLLSMFAVRAGARYVVAIESSNVFQYARNIIYENNLTNKIKVIYGFVDQVELPCDIKEVDIIISEWMGHCLFYGSTLDSVIYARDKWLKPGGLIFPDKAHLFITGIEDRKYRYSKVRWWNDVYGFNMSVIKEAIMKDVQVEAASPEQVVTDSHLLKSVDLYTAANNEAIFTTDFTLKALRQDYIQSLLTYFTVEFSHGNRPITLSTHPYSQYTYWKQSRFFLKSHIATKKDEVLSGRFSMQPFGRNADSLKFDITINFDGEITTLSEQNIYELKK